MNSKKRFSLLLLVGSLVPWVLNAQCGIFGPYDNPTCNEVTRTYGSLFSCPSGHCRWDFSHSLNFTMVSRTANTITLYNGRSTPTTSSVYVSMYDSINNCTATMEWTDLHMQQTFPDIAGTIPACPVPTQVYEYTASHYPNNPFATTQETMTWSISGGTIQSISSSYPFTSIVEDTVRVLWNAAGPHRLIATRISNGLTYWGPQTCTNSDTIWDGGTTPPLISGAEALCGTITGTYSIPALDPAFLYSWSCSNGSITTGQGTANVTVSWLGSGVLTLTRTSIACGWSDAATKNVTISGSPAPMPVLPPTATACTGQSVVLYPGAFSTYQWSNLYTSSTIAPTTAGTYTVTVTNAAGCQATASTIASFSGTAPAPNLGPDQGLCSGASVTLNPGSFGTYLWSNGATTQAISATVSSTYSVTVTNPSGCSAVDYINLSNLTSPSPNLGPNQNVCVGTPVTLNSGTFTSYLWSTGATTQTISPTVSGTYSVTVTDANGCTGNGSTAVSLNPLPSFSLGNDTIICADTSLILNGPSGMNAYAWSNGPTTMANTIATGGTYLLTITDANGCTAFDSIIISGLTDCVFPGDANYDGVANNLDVLNIGAYYGTAGPVRPAATTDWYGQSLADWGGALPAQADPKHSDCNGDGIVQDVDTLAVALNYAKTHNKAAAVTSGDNLFVVPMRDSVAPGDTAWFAIHLGDQNSLADSVYGVAFSVQHSGTGVLQPGITTVAYTNCWFAPAQSRLDFTHHLGAMAGLDLAISRTDQQNQIGFGEICRIAIPTNPSPAGQYVPLTVTLNQALLVDSSLNPIAVLPVPGTTVISTTLNAIAGAIANPRIYPNPANDFIQLELPGAPIDLVEVYDAFGKLQASFLGAGESEMQLSLAGMADGIYLLHIRSNDKAWVAKQVLRK